MPTPPAHCYVIFDRFGAIVGLLSLEDDQVKRFELYAGWKCKLPSENPGAFRQAAAAASLIASHTLEGS
jgi:hypothetical protein